MKTKRKNNKKSDIAIWIIRFFIVLISAALIYMVVTKQSVPMEMGSVNSRTYSLKEHPVTFMIIFVTMAYFDWFLLKVHKKAMEEKTRKGKK